MYSDSYELTFRNAGYVISTLLIRFGFAVEKPFDLMFFITAIAFGEICREAGLPNGVINIVPGYGNEAGEYLSNHPGINHISFTGSVEVGSKIQQNASKNIVPVTLELGGKSPQILFEDADIKKAIPFLLKAELICFVALTRTVLKSEGPVLI